METKLAKLIEDLQEANELISNSFDGTEKNKRLINSIKESASIIAELQLFYLTSRQKAASVDIGLQEAQRLRQLFKTNLPVLAQLFPISFAIDVKDIITLIGKSGAYGRLRMYPIYEERTSSGSGRISNKFSWAFVAEKPGKQLDTSSVIDVLEPCPPDCPPVGGDPLE